MNIRVLALFGSPRRGGNTDILMEELISGITRDGGVDVIRQYLSEMNIKPCTGCGYCEQSGGCNIEDDMQMIYPLLEESHIIVVSSPVYFYGLSAQCKVMIDRAHVFWARKYVLKREWSSDDEIIRQGFFISTAGTDNPDLFTGSKLAIHYFFDGLDIVNKGAILATNVQKYAAIKSYPNKLKEAYNQGVELINPS